MMPAEYDKKITKRILSLLAPQRDKVHFHPARWEALHQKHIFQA